MAWNSLALLSPRYKQPLRFLGTDSKAAICAAKRCKYLATPCRRGNHACRAASYPALGAARPGHFFCYIPISTCARVTVIPCKTLFRWIVSNVLKKHSFVSSNFDRIQNRCQFRAEYKLMRHKNVPLVILLQCSRGPFLLSQLLLLNVHQREIWNIL